MPAGETTGPGTTRPSGHVPMSSMVAAMSMVVSLHRPVHNQASVAGASERNNESVRVHLESIGEECVGARTRAEQHVARISLVLAEGGGGHEARDGRPCRRQLSWSRASRGLHVGDDAREREGRGSDGVCDGKHDREDEEAAAAA